MVLGLGAMMGYEFIPREVKEKSFYDLKMQLPGKKGEFDFAQLKGRPTLIVNTASKCGYTVQYTALEALHNDFEDKGLTVLGFPCDQFANQEFGDDAAIEEFCTLNHGVTFPLMKKSDVNGKNMNEPFAWLKAHGAKVPGGGGVAGTTSIKWNFTKFIGGSLAMLVIGLTGGIASGKSTVSSLLSSPPYSLPIIDADLLARQVIEPGTSGYRLVVDHFGPDRVLQADGVSLDRAAIGEIIFNDPDERSWLNGVVHPRVRRGIVRQVVGAWLRGEWAVVLDVPLLIEAGLWKWVGEIVVVYVNEPLQHSRLLGRHPGSMTPAQASSRIASQMPLSSKTAYADSVLDNSGTPADLAQQVARAVARWRRQQGGRTGWWWRVCWVIPPVGVVAGLLCLVGRWMKGERGKGRRRTRGEVGRGRDGRERGVESVEMDDLGDVRRRSVSAVGLGGVSKGHA